MLTWLHIGDPHACEDDGWKRAESPAVIPLAASGLGGSLDSTLLPDRTAEPGEARVVEALSAAHQPAVAFPGLSDPSASIGAWIRRGLMGTRLHPTANGFGWRS